MMDGLLGIHVVVHGCYKSHERASNNDDYIDSISILFQIYRYCSLIQEVVPLDKYEAWHFHD